MVFNKTAVVDHTPDMASRVRSWILEKFPTDTVQRLSVTFECDKRTAVKWIGDPPEFPQNRHFVKMCRVWGVRFLGFVFEPAAGPYPGPDTDDEVELDRRLALAGQLMAEASALIADAKSVITNGKPDRSR